MKIKSLLLLVSVGIISATAFGATAASWAVTDNTDSFGIKIAPAQANKRIYLNTGTDDKGNPLWNQGNAWFAAYCFDGEPTPSKFVKLTPCEEEDYFTFVLEPSYKGILFSRQKPDSSIPSWDNQWNQTVNIDISASYDTYTITGWGETPADPSEKQLSTVAASSHETDGCIFSEEEIINVIPKTCDTDGSYDVAHHCKVCGKQVILRHEIIPHGHDTEHVEHIDAVAPTCTEDGNIEYWHCKDCLRYYKDSALIQEITLAETVVEKLGHSFDETTWYQKHDSTLEYYHYHKCIRCDAEGDVEACYGGAGTATEEHGDLCEKCGYPHTDPLPHTHIPTEHPAVAATCTTAGNSKYYSCSKCGKFFSDQACTIEIEEDSWIIPALGHNMTEHPATAATCTTPGNSLYYSCSRCNKYFSDSQGVSEIAENSWIIPALGHDFSSSWTYNDTHHWHACSRCDAKDGYGIHTWDSGVVTKEPTYTSKGEMTYTCTVCSKTKIEEIDYLEEIRVFLEGSNTNRGQSEGHDYETQLNSIGDGWYYHDYDLGNCYVRVKAEIWKNNTWIRNEYPYNSSYYYQITNGGHTTGGVAYNLDNPTAAWTKSSQWDNYGNLRYVQKPSS